MGTSTDAHCYACGFNAVLMLGGGMRNFKTFYAWPVRCSRCLGFAATNLLETHRTCLDCGRSDFAFLQESFGGPSEAVAWNDLKTANMQRRGEVERHWASNDAGAYEVAHSCADLVLTKGRYACPTCGEPQLRFGTEFSGGVIMWD